MVQHSSIDHTGIPGVGGDVATDAIWNAAGDLAVGTGADAAARLAIGANGTVLTSNGTTATWVTASSGADDTIPAGGTLYAGTSTTGWTAFGTGGLTTFDADSTVPGAFYLAKTTAGGNNIYGVSRSISSLPRTITCRVKAGMLYANYHFMGIMIGDSTPAAMQSWAMSRDNASGIGSIIQRGTWTSVSNNSASTNYTSATSPGWQPSVPFWLRAVVNSSSNVDFQASQDGYIYYTFSAAFNPGITIATFGMAIGGFGITQQSAFDWIHES